MAIDFEFLKLDVADGIAKVTFNNPTALNALHPKVIDELDALTTQLAANKKIEVIVFVGAGEKAFIAGADIKAMSHFNPADAYEFARKGQKVFAALEALPQTTIAAVNGFALGGGCEFILACDLVYASKKAKLGQPEVNLGIIPGFGGTVRLTHRVGVARAKELIFRGDMISAEQAYQFGMINGFFEHDSLLDEVMLLARSLQQRSPNAIAYAKRSIHFALDHSVEDSFEKEAQLFRESFGHPDQKEGMEAFVNKRPPKWSRG